MPKIARQLATSRMSWPSPGASAGTRMKTAMTEDMIRAIARPSYWSRTIAMVTIRGPAAPIPWRKRPTSITVKLVASADKRQPTMNRAKPR